LDIPVKMESGQVLKLDGKGNLQLFDKNWKLIETLDPGKIPLLDKGKNRIMVDAGFTVEGSSKLKIEVKTIGKAELITIK
jgi:F0F1-type ATP synthase epsilon subunit